MMHEGEKSDSAVVAKKPTNKAGRPAAEPVEPRAGTKGNANQQSTRRAQDRESVSRRSSPRFCTTSIRPCFGQRFMRSRVTPPPASTG
jgi:hypothetical protein